MANVSVIFLAYGQCGPGKEPSTNEPGACLDCQPGTYSSTTDDQPCTLCPDGKTTVNIGATDITECKGNQIYCIEKG